MENAITILDFQGQEVGDAKASLCSCSRGSSENITIERFTGGLAFYESQFPSGSYWPIFAFNDIWIKSAHRRRGIGSRAFNEIADHYQDLGARLGLLRIGTQGDSFYEGRAWRTKMYNRIGRIALRHHPDERTIIGLMYLPMKDRTVTSASQSRLIRVFDPPLMMAALTPVLQGAWAQAGDNDETTRRLLGRIVRLLAFGLGLRVSSNAGGNM